nr:UDP-N-acetylmuramoyl-L-alanyl-D-glutamate--2,6-diaminopimelate ligase [bacterium]
MKLNALLYGVHHTQKCGSANPEISGITFDSRRVAPGDLFCCLTGLKADGHAFAQAAVDRGAVALLCERKLDITGQAVQIIVPDTRAAMALCCGNFYGNPASGMCMIGVTGTNGKTTVTHLIKSIGEAFGKRVGLIGTNYTLIEHTRIESEMTTPDPFELHGLLRRMADSGVQWVVMEVSAHALHFRKLEGIHYDVGVFTNITQDHLNDFGSMEAYFNAKKKLLVPGFCSHAVLGADDPKLLEFARTLKVPVTTFGTVEDAGVRATNIELGQTGVGMRLEAQGRGVDVQLHIPGRFSVLNGAAAAAAALCLDVPWAVIRYGLLQAKGVPGRMEVVPSGGRGAFLVDYAHTPDALENVLRAVRGFARGRVMVVFGCGGDRDRGKRPIMGRIAGEMADACIITSDNPRTEDPEAIIDEILSGMEGCHAQVIRQPDRRAAIQTAVQWAGPDDVVLVAGKGHEPYQDIMGVKHPFSDQETIRECLAQ